MGRRVFKAFAANLCLSAWATTLANAQGVSEMGAVYAMPKAHPSAGVSGAVNRMYGVAADAAGAAVDGGGLPAGSTNGGAYTPTTYQKYAKQSDDLYIQAMASERAGKINDAQKFYYQALGLRQRVWGVGDPGALTILLKLGDINVKEKHYDYAETCYKQYLGGLAKQAGPGAYESAFALNKLAQLYVLKQQYDEAASMLRNILALQERKFGPDSKEYFTARMNLIDALIQDKEFVEGRDVSKEALAAETHKNNEHSQDYLHALSCYAICERGLHHDDEAKKAEDKVAVLRQELGTPSENAPPASDAKAKTDDKSTNSAALSAPTTAPSGTAPATNTTQSDKTSMDTNKDLPTAPTKTEPAK
jgi:tetratricopeptide (TPR) repeat protein